MSGECLVVDSSVAYKWFYRADEPGADEADALLEAHMEDRLTLTAPTTLPVELANAVRYARLSDAQVLRIIDLVGATRLHLFHTTTDRLERAAVLALKHDLSVYDALFLGLAEELDCPLVTADKRAFGSLRCGVEIRLV